MLLQIVEMKRYSVTGSVIGRRDACEDLQLAWTCAHEKDRGELSVKDSTGRYVCGRFPLEGSKLEITRR